MSEQTTETTNAKTAEAGVTLTSGRGGIVGIKAGMTQVYGADGQSLAVTVVELKPNTIRVTSRSQVSLVFTTHKSFELLMTKA
jgi:hypothetical protein